MSLAAGSGCTGLGIERLAPPGFVKYEELAGDAPPNPEIQRRIAERRTAIRARYPNLSEQPSAKPVLTPAAEREALIAELVAAREDLARAALADRAAASAERGEGYSLPGDIDTAPRPLDAVADDLARKVKEDDEAARAERGLPPRAPKNESE